MSQYFFNDKSRSPKNKLQTSGSFGFKSSQFSQKDNNSIGESVKNINPSIFNQSSIQKLNNNESGEYIYFQNDSVLSELQNELKGVRKTTQKQSSGQKKKKQAINYSKEISFQDSLQKSKNMRNDSFQIDEYGTGKNGLPPSLKKPKFGFKTSETAQSSAIIKQIGDEYQIAENKKKEKKENLVSMYSNDMSRNQQRSKHFNVQRSNRLQQQQGSISSIKGPIQQPSIASKPLSQSKSLSGSMNFKSVFKHKKQKASIINSSLNKHKHTKSNQSISSYRNNAIGESYVDKNFVRDREVKVAELNDLRELQNKLGEINHQNRKIIQLMIEKDQEIQRLKRRKIQIQAEDPYAMIKQNQLIKAFLGNKPNKKSSLLSSSNNLRAINSAKSLNQQTFKRSSQISSLHDYDIKQHKFRVQPKVLTKMQKKAILSNRGMVLSQKYLDVGFSMKENVLTVYLTLKRQYDEVGIRLQENSFVMSDSIDRIFKDSAIGKQIKFKTQIKSTRCKNPEDNFDFPSLKISLKDQQRFENKLHQFKVDLPITVYNVAKQLEPSSTIQSISKASTAKQVFKTQTFVGCKELIRQPESYLMKLFPTGHYQKDQNAFQIGFLWKQKRDFLKIRIKERSFLIQGEGNPSIITFQVLKSIVSLLIEEKTLD